MILLACVAGGLLGSLHNRRLRVDERGEKIEKALFLFFSPRSPNAQAPVVQAICWGARARARIPPRFRGLAACSRARSPTKPPATQAMIPYAAEGHQITVCVDHLSCCQR